MKTVRMICKSCDSFWLRTHGAHSPYERQALEQVPCPSCGCVTLTVEAMQPEKKKRQPFHFFGLLTAR